MKMDNVKMKIDNVKMDNLKTDNVKSLFNSDMLMWLSIILVLAILGYAAYTYFYKSDHTAGDVVVDSVSTGLDTAADTLEMAGKGTEQIGKGVGEVLSEIGDELDVHIANKTSQQPKGDDNDSSIQMPKKSGYCYIGEDKGNRTCIYSGKRDICMSGDIFPTLDVCINPKLRA